MVRTQVREVTISLSSSSMPLGRTHICSRMCQAPPSHTPIKRGPGVGPGCLDTFLTLEEG